MKQALQIALRDGGPVKKTEMDGRRSHLRSLVANWNHALARRYRGHLHDLEWLANLQRSPFLPSIFRRRMVLGGWLGGGIALHLSAM